jgi:hypothetical protein
MTSSRYDTPSLRRTASWIHASNLRTPYVLTVPTYLARLGMYTGRGATASYRQGHIWGKSVVKETGESSCCNDVHW